MSSTWFRRGSDIAKGSQMSLSDVVDMSPTWLRRGSDIADVVKTWFGNLYPVSVFACCPSRLT